MPFDFANNQDPVIESRDNLGVDIKGCNFTWTLRDQVPLVVKPKYLLRQLLKYLLRQL